MQVTKLGYRTWTGPRRQHTLFRWLPIARVGIKSVLQRKIFWLFLLMGLVLFLFYFAIIYFVAQLQAEVMQRGGNLPGWVREQTFTGTGRSYRDFIFGQSTVVMLFLGFAGSILVGNDFRFRAVPFYLSKPILKVHYFLGKLGAAAFLTSMITLVPALLLFVEYGSLTESWAYFRDEWRILFAILGYGSLVSLTGAVMILGIAALLQQTIPIVVAWGTIFLFLPTVGELFRSSASGKPWQWDLLNFWEVLRWVSNCMFGIDADKYGERLPMSLGVIAAWVGFSLWAFWKRIKAVDVVR